MTIQCATCEGTGLVVRVIETGLLIPWFRRTDPASYKDRAVPSTGYEPRSRCPNCGGDGRIEKDPRPHDLRVWAIRHPPAAPTLIDVLSLSEATTVINALALSDQGMPWVGASAFGLEVFEDGEWGEWENANGQSIAEIIEEA